MFDLEHTVASVDRDEKTVPSLFNASLTAIRSCEDDLTQTLSLTNVVAELKDDAIKCRYV